MYIYMYNIYAYIKEEIMILVELYVFISFIKMCMYV
jgi:hypothetical protein